MIKRGNGLEAAFSEKLATCLKNLRWLGTFPFTVAVRRTINAHQGRLFQIGRKPELFHAIFRLSIFIRYTGYEQLTVSDALNYVLEEIFFAAHLLKVNPCRIAGIFELFFQLSGISPANAQLVL
ncbi:hypothetical protein BpHYR1_034687 [Brachionus plicatilis]|uniref:Uncharacterized protein n=1 Tax=Brachionus plicatilis TaxID=10195 RepID=A0A3M7SHK0_BRAPC|nr:hypothetical protein BpHYR1_034687 [Brachionus plicatilis]